MPTWHLERLLLSRRCRSRITAAVGGNRPVVSVVPDLCQPRATVVLSPFKGHTLIGTAFADSATAAMNQ